MPRWRSWALIVSTLVAFGTILLAFSTWNLAKQTQRDVEAQFIPVVLRVHENADVQIFYDARDDHTAINIPARCVGPGTALDIVAVAEGWDSEALISLGPNSTGVVTLSHAGDYLTGGIAITVHLRYLSVNRVT